MTWLPDPAVLAIGCCDAPLAPVGVIAWGPGMVSARYQCPACGRRSVRDWVDVSDDDHETVR